MLEIVATTDIPTLPQFVYVRLRKAILTGELAPDTVLRQEGIAERLGVSRLPVREALARLETDGLVVSRPRRGYVVASISLDEVAEITDLRAMLEKRAATLAAKRRTRQDIEDVERLLVAMDGMTADSAEDISRFLVRNAAFHSRMFSCSGSIHTCRLLQTLRNSIDRYIFLGTTLVGTLNYGHADHLQIFEAFKAGDAERIGSLSRRHVAETGQRLYALLEKQGCAQARK